MTFLRNRHPAPAYWWSMIPRVKPEGRLFRKPVSSPDQVRARLFRDHALAVRLVLLQVPSAGLRGLERAVVSLRPVLELDLGEVEREVADRHDVAGRTLVLV